MQQSIEGTFNRHHNATLDLNKKLEGIEDLAGAHRESSMAAIAALENTTALLANVGNSSTVRADDVSGERETANQDETRLQI